MSADPEQTAQAWEATVEAIRARSPAPGVARPDQIAGMSGLQMFQAMLRGELPPAPIAATLDFLLVEAEEGRVVFQGTPRFEHYNPAGSVHGGWAATLLDSCMFCAVHSLVPAGQSSTTVEIKVNFLRPITTRTGVVRAEGRIIQSGSRIAIAEGRLYDPAGRVYAHGTTTCLILNA